MLRPCSWFWILVAYLLVRGWYLKRPVVLIICLMCLGARIAGCQHYQDRLNKNLVPGRLPVTQTILVLPDNIKCEGDLAYLTGVDQRTKQRETMTLIIHNDHQRQLIRRLNHPQYWQVEGDLQPVMPATNENEFNSQRYYRQQGIVNQLRIRQLVSVQIVKRWSLQMYCHVWRRDLSAYFGRMPQPLAGYCRQLLIGQNDPRNADLLTNVKRLGVIHLFCISGLHVVLLVAILRRVGTYLWLDRELIDTLLLVSLPCYLIIAGGSVSLVRAVIMAEVGLLRGIWRLDSLDGWAISLLGGLIWEPELLLSLGGQLTYLLSLMLQVMDRHQTALRRNVYLGLISMPAILSYVFEFHWLSLLISYPLIPFFSLVLFPLIILSATSFWLLPVLAEPVNQLLILFQRLMALGARLPGEVHFGKPPLLVSLILFGLTLWCIAGKNKWRWATLLLAYMACFILIHFPLSGEVTFVDIGQGDCIIIREPFNRRVMMIDTGGKLTFGHFRSNTGRNVASRTSINYLKSLGISRIDTIYLSHHDTDHIGYLPTVLQAMQVGQIAVPAGMEHQRGLHNKLGPQQVPPVIPVTDQHPNLDLGLKILHPFQPGTAQNQDSLVLAGQFGDKRFVFTGDLDRPGERAVIARYPQLQADVLKLGHHGSRTASDQQFLHQLRPQWAIISAGRFNRYHHPNDEVIKELRDEHINYLSTQQYGMIRYRYCWGKGNWTTTLRGDELKWTLPNCLNN